MLGEHNGQPGFVKLGSTERVPKDKAYIVVNDGDAEFYPLESTTGITSVNSAPSANGKWYTLGGQRTDQPRRGIYVNQGRKHIIR